MKKLFKEKLKLYSLELDNSKYYQLYKIKYYLMYPIYTLIDVKNRIQFRIYMLYKYMKQGYNAYNGDWTFLFNDIDFKLRLLAEDMYQSDFENSLKHTKQILKFKVMLRRMTRIGEEKKLQHWDYLEEKYGPLNFKSVPSECGKYATLEIIDRPKVVDNPELKEQCEREEKIAAIKITKEVKDYKRKVMRYFLKHYENWWT